MGIVLIGGALAGGPSLLAVAGVDVGGWASRPPGATARKSGHIRSAVSGCRPGLARLSLAGGVAFLIAVLAAWAHRLRRDRGQLGL